MRPRYTYGPRHGLAYGMWSGGRTCVKADQQDTRGVDPPDVARRKRLVFWSAFALDLRVAMGLGRSTTITPSQITQKLPEDECIPPNAKGLVSPFPYFCRTIYWASRINNCLNSQAEGTPSPDDLGSLTEQVVNWYQTLPIQLEWSHRR